MSLPFLAAAGLFFATAPSPTPLPAPDTVTITAAPVRTFVPARAFGAGIDGAEAGTAERLFDKPAVLKEMRSLGFRSLTYRLRTELGIEAWHWNPRGHWSDPHHRQGYWTSGAVPGNGPISVSWGYRLPRRGSTTDQANDDGYSRLDDGNPRTFWKSNPYLDQHFTHETNERHPQWIVVDLGRPKPVNAMRLRWGVPFATLYRVEYCVTPPSAAATSGFDPTFEPGARWVVFPGGVVDKGRGGDATLRLSKQPITTQFVRIWMTESSETAPATSREVRDRLGYALRELSVGEIDTRGRFTDFVRHGRTNRNQSPILVSSTDPWHRSSDRDSKVEQPGLDRVAKSGLTNGLPMLTPVGTIYDTPENAAAELRYLRARHIPVTRMELGEEPDGQYISPEDYGALYVQFADALHRVDPTAQLGGPSFQTAVEGWIHWPDAAGDTSWLRRFLRYLKARGHLSDFAFFSFEWYPFDDLSQPSSKQAPRNAPLLTEALDTLVDEGLPRTIPWIISEYGYSSYATRDEVTLPVALVNAETVAKFLALGGETAYLYGYPPGGLNIEKGRPGATWGDVLALLGDDEGNVRARLPAYWSGWLLTHVWTDDSEAGKPHTLLSATVNGPDGKPDDLLAAFPVRQPNGRLSLLLINKDASHPRRITLPTPEYGGSVRVWTYGANEYTWKDAGEDGHPTRSMPPSETRISGGTGQPVVTVPPFALVVVRTDAPASVPSSATPDGKSGR